MNMNRFRITRPGFPAMAVLTGAMFFACLMLSPEALAGNPQQRILLITGGHDFNEATFYGLFDGLDNITCDTISQPRANHYLLGEEVHRYDALVFYDMWEEITSEQQAAYRKLLDKGMGMVFLHHSLVSYQQWDEFTQVRGGKYRQPGYDTIRPSGYAHDIWMEVKVLDRSHPVCKGLSDFRIYDEGYSNIEILDQVRPLLGVDHEACAEVVAWTNEYLNSRIVYVMLGHGPEAHQHENYRLLIKNAIHWVND